MSIFAIIKIILALGTIATGFLSLIKPKYTRASRDWLPIDRAAFQRSGPCWAVYSLPWAFPLSS